MDDSRWKNTSEMYNKIYRMKKHVRALDCTLHTRRNVNSVMYFEKDTSVEQLKEKIGLSFGTLK